MNNHPLEIILARHFADNLSLAAFITNEEGDLIFYNESAEEILGKRYEETGPMPLLSWASIFKPTDKEGNHLEPENLPLVRTLEYRKPAHDSFWIENLKGEKYFLSVSSFPIIGRNETFLGAMAIFWKEEFE
ncbi:MAG: PAS domain-containing protein [Bacteroidota bacterium]